MVERDHQMDAPSYRWKITLLGTYWRYVALVFLCCASLAIWIIWDSWHYLHQPLTNEPDAVVTLIPGDNFTTLLAKLQAEGWLQSSWQARLFSIVTGSTDYLQAGEYSLTGYSLLTLLQAMREGQMRQYYLVILPGVRWSQLQASLASAPHISHNLAGLEPNAVYEQLDLRLPFLEGAFYPDTYAYRKGDQDITLLRAAHQKMLAVLAELWLSRADYLPISLPEEALILASIIEKETGLDSDRGMIGAVLSNRLRMGMKLEVDPTVIYGLGSEFDGDLKRRHLRRPTPYNTYVIPRLPPTPIALPSRASIQAALHPAKNKKVLFFVARGDGSSQFSNTRQEHQSAVRLYQLKQAN